MNNQATPRLIREGGKVIDLTSPEAVKENELTADELDIIALVGLLSHTEAAKPENEPPPEEQREAWEPKIVRQEEA